MPIYGDDFLTSNNAGVVGYRVVLDFRCIYNIIVDVVAQGETMVTVCSRSRQNLVQRGESECSEVGRKRDNVYGG